MFDGARLKVERANYHILQLQDVYSIFFKSTPHRLLCDFEPDIQRYGVRVEVSEDVPAECAIILGDIFHNLRSALDHVAVELELKAPAPREIKYIKFPTHKTRVQTH